MILRTFLKSFFRLEFGQVKEDQNRIEIQLTNHVTETNKEIKELQSNQASMQKDLSEVKEKLFEVKDLLYKSLKK